MKKIEIDISGRIDQKSYNSVIVMLAEDKSLENSVFLSSKLTSASFFRLSSLLQSLIKCVVSI